jgi:glutamyl-tRNA reductase
MMAETIVLLGVNHKTTPLAIREKLALSAGYDEPLEALAQVSSINEYYLLSTCNRVEIIFTCTDVALARREVLDRLFITSVSREEIAGCFYLYENSEAVRHLFMVAASLDSMIIGEAQILGQLKEAFRHASEKKTGSLILNRLLHKAFAAAKRVRTETEIGANAVSISYAAVELGRKIFGSLDGKRVMLIGAGEMAELAAEHLVSQGVKEVVVANRTLTTAVTLARRFRGRAVALAEIVQQLEKVDIVISSTGATEFVVVKDEIDQVMPKRKNKPLFLIDIAVPRDIDPAINDLDNVYLYDIDDLNHVVEKNRSKRDQEAVKAARIVDEETIKFMEWLDNMAVTPTIKELRSLGEQVCREELARTFTRLNGLSGNDKKSIETMAFAIAGKLCHNPLHYLKDNHHCITRQERVRRVRIIFNLDPSDKQTGK